jgi:dienelactone hydrolase
MDPGHYAKRSRETLLLRTITFLAAVVVTLWCVVCAPRRTDGVPIEQVVYPGVHHSFYYPEFQPGRTIFGHWLEYNEEAATDATRRMREFLERHLN